MKKTIFLTATLLLLSLISISFVLASGSVPVQTFYYTNATSLSNPYSTIYSNGYVYVISYSGRSLTTFNVNGVNAYSPVQTAYYTNMTSLNLPYDIQISNNYLYIISNIGKSLTVFNINGVNASSPVQTTFFTHTDLNEVYVIKIVGDYLYAISSSNKTLVTFNISNPLNPIWLSNYTNTTYLHTVYDIEANNGYLYVSSHYNDAITVFNANGVNASNPIPVYSYSNTSSIDDPLSITILNNYLYVLGARLTTFNINGANASQPAQTSVFSNVTILSGAIQVVNSNNYLYAVSINAKSLSTFNISNPSIPTLTNSYSNATSLNEPYSVTANPNFLYIASWLGNSLTTFNITDPIICVPNWSCSLYTCNASNINICTAVSDSNSCGVNFTGTLSTYNDGACNYCTEDIIAVNSSCYLNLGNWYFDSSYQDNNYGSCCAITGLSEDCSILTAPYNETTTGLCTCQPDWFCSTFNCDSTNNLACTGIGDNNSCGFNFTGILSDYDDGVCDYCTSDIIAVSSECYLSNNYYYSNFTYEDNNYFSCCAITGLSEDCSISTAPYNETTKTLCQITNIDQNIDCDVVTYTEYGFGADKINWLCRLNSSMADSFCKSYIKDAIGGIVQVNPAYSQKTQTFISINNNIEDRTSFKSENGLVTVSFTKENLVFDSRQYIYGVECSDGTNNAVYEFITNPEYESIKSPITRWFWIDKNVNGILISLFLGFIILFLIAWGIHIIRGK